MRGLLIHGCCAGCLINRGVLIFVVVHSLTEVLLYPLQLIGLSMFLADAVLGLCMQKKQSDLIRTSVNSKH